MRKQFKAFWLLASLAILASAAGCNSEQIDQIAAQAEQGIAESGTSDSAARSGETVLEENAADPSERVDPFEQYTGFDHPQQPATRFDPGPALFPASRREPEGGAAPPAGTIKVATFNIQVFGTSKLGKPDAMKVLVQVVRRFDIVAVQEIRAADQTVVAQFVEQINAGGLNYVYAIGPRLGRTSSKEQYAFIFNADRVAIDQNSIYTVDDPQDRLHREPMVARFRARGPDPASAFTFTLVNIHTDPDETDTELDALADVFTAVQRDGSGEDDVILLGDLNVDHRNLGRLGQVPDIAYVIAGEKTNTRGTKSYDNIVFNRRTTVEFTGSAGVLDLLGAYGLTMEQALAVSDHLPVWAEFSAYEGSSSGPVATRPGEPPR